jgi:uncharacterized protein YjbJ (UPF0337 family)
MEAGTEDQVKGKFHEVKVDLKARAAKAAGNPEQVAEGRDEKLAGKVQKKVGQSMSLMTATVKVRRMVMVLSRDDRTSMAPFTNLVPWSGEPMEHSYSFARYVAIDTYTMTDLETKQEEVTTLEEALQLKEAAPDPGFRGKQGKVA